MRCWRDCGEPATPLLATGAHADRRSSSTTRRRISRRKCTSATCAARSSAMRWCACSRRLGHRVIRQNHVGDWGTQFGMLRAHTSKRPATPREMLDGPRAVLSSRQAALRRRPGIRRTRARAASSRCNRATPTRECVVAPFHRASRSRHCDAVYRRLGVSLTRADVHAESAYNDDLAERRRDARRRQGSLTISDGAKCVFLDEFKGQGRNAAAGDRAEVRRRLPVLDDRSRGRSAIVVNAARRSRALLRRCAPGAALPTDVRRRAARRLRAAEH